MSINSNLREAAIQTIEGNKVFLNRTASVQVPASVFRDLGQSDVQQRLSYSVFVRDTLFQSSDENQSNLTVGSIIVAVRVNGSTASGNLSTPINVTFQASEVSGCKHNYINNMFIAKNPTKISICYISTEEFVALKCVCYYIQCAPKTKSVCARYNIY